MIKPAFALPILALGFISMLSVNLGVHAFNVTCTDIKSELNDAVQASALTQEEADSIYSRCFAIYND
jgi:hypothetical protein